MPQREGYENATAYAISLALIFTVCVGLLRLWIRKSAYGQDDVVIGAATLVALGHTGASYAALSHGLGKSWVKLKTESDVAELNEASVAGIALFFTALYLSKCAMLAFLRRITKAPPQVLLYNVCNGAVGVIGLGSILTALAGCPLESGYYWAFSLNSATCPRQDVRWQVITGLDIVTELLLLVLPIHLVWTLQMPRSKKAMIVIAFWVRLPVLGFSITRDYYTMQLQRPGSDAGLQSSTVMIWLETELAYAIGASTLSALKSFTESVNTGFGLGFTRGKGEDSYGKSNVSGSSGQSSKTEKPQTATRFQRCPNRAATPTTSKNGTKVLVSPGAQFDENEAALRLRPATPFATHTSIRAEPIGATPLWRVNSAFGRDSLGDDMVIVRETVYEVHDATPILPVMFPRA